jgi:hypothetical protein
MTLVLLIAFIAILAAAYRATLTDHPHVDRHAEDVDDILSWPLRPNAEDRDRGPRVAR